MSSNAEKDAEALGARLRELREGAGLRQEELADQLGVTDRTIRNWEMGARPIPSDMVQRMADLKIDVIYLLLGRRSGYFTLNEAMLSKAVAWVDGPWREACSEEMTDLERVRWIFKFYLKGISLGRAEFGQSAVQPSKRRRA